jgi:hypothetical protein
MKNKQQILSDILTRCIMNEAARVHVKNSAGYEKAPVVISVTFADDKIQGPKVLTNNTAVFNVGATGASMFPVRVSFQPTSGDSTAGTTIELSDPADTFAVSKGYGIQFTNGSTNELLAFNDPTDALLDAATLSIPPGEMPVVVSNRSLQHVFDPNDLTWKVGLGPVCDFLFMDSAGNTVYTLAAMKPMERRPITTKPFASIRSRVTLINTETDAVEIVTLTVSGIDSATIRAADNYPRQPGKVLQLSYYATADESMVTETGQPSPAVVLDGFGALGPFLSALGMPQSQQWSAMVILNATPTPVKIKVVQQKPIQPTRLDPFARSKFTVQPGGYYPLLVYPGDTTLYFQNGDKIAVPSNKYPYYTDDRLDFVLHGTQPKSVVQLDSKDNVFYLDIVQPEKSASHVMTMSDTVQYKHTSIYKDVYESRIKPKLQNSAKTTPAKTAGAATQSSGLDGVSIAMIVIAAVSTVGIIALGIALGNESKTLEMFFRKKK